MNRKLKRFVEYFKSMPTILRMIFGFAFILGGIFGILPILGFWMIPLGLLILSFDFPWARRGYLSIVVLIRKFRQKRKQKKISKNKRSTN